MGRRLQLTVNAPQGIKMRGEDATHFYVKLSNPVFTPHPSSFIPACRRALDIA
jgi:hypothetical protein